MVSESHGEFKTSFTYVCETASLTHYRINNIARGTGEMIPHRPDTIGKGDRRRRENEGTGLATPMSTGQSACIRRSCPNTTMD